MNNEQRHINDDLLVKHLLGEATVAEQAEVNAWLNESEANRKEYGQFKKIWDDSKKLAANSIVDENEAWKNFQDMVELAEGKKTTPKTIPLASRKTNWIRVAAILVVFLGCGWLINQFVLKDYAYTYVSTENETFAKTLPDGSIVTLNKNSSIKYSDFLAGNTRKVTLTGEAFFDVTPDKSKPFIITANDAEITVVGTSFNVKSSQTKTEVIVETGIVEVSKKKKGIQVAPGEKAIVLQNNAVPVKEMVDDVLYNYYRTKELVCNNTPLWRLADVLNEAYNVNISIADIRLKDLPINTTFKNQTIDEILFIISETHGVKIEMNGKNITIR